MKGGFYLEIKDLPQLEEATESDHVVSSISQKTRLISFKNIFEKISFSSLVTTAKNIIGSINELKGRCDTLDTSVSKLNTDNTKIKRIYNVKTGNTETENYLCSVEAGKAYLIFVREMSEATNITGCGLYYLCAARNSNSTCSTGKVCGDLSYTALGLSGGLKIQLNIRAQYKDISVFEVPML